MNAAEFVTRIVRALDGLNIRYMVVGSFSSNVYGDPRSTKDADFVLQMGTRSINEIVFALDGDFVLDPQMTFETITSTMRYRLSHHATNFTIELFLLSDDSHDQERFRRRVSGDIGDGQSTFVPTAEDVVITKLRWSKHGKRHKDVDDASNVLTVQVGNLDLAYLRHWCDAHQTRDLLEKLLREASLSQEEL